MNPSDTEEITDVDVPTSHGDIPLSRLIHIFDVYMAQEKRRSEKRKEFLKTDEGKEWNRVKYKTYYEKNKEKVQLKNKARYHAKKALENVSLE